MTRIIATLGLASNSAECITKLMHAGVDIFRLNFSHGDHDWHKKTIQLIKTHAPQTKILLDTKGPEMRTGILKHPITIHKGDLFTLVFSESEQNPETKSVFVNHPNLPNDIEVGDMLSLDSGLIDLQVCSVQKDQVETTALHSGKIHSKRHLNLIGKDVSLPTLTQHDKSDIQFGIENGVDIIALSFLRKSKGIIQTREILTQYGKPDIQVYAKIESQAGIDNLEDIAHHADGLMVARGDLGVETPLEFVPYKQKQIIETAHSFGIPVIVATEMLHSMIQNPRPTRAEVSDVMLAVWQGATYVMLSGESASGKYPVESVQIMKKIIDAGKNHLR